MTAERRPSAAAGPSSFGNLGSAEPQTAAAACVAEPENAAESGCMLEREHKHLFLKVILFQLGLFVKTIW